MKHEHTLIFRRLSKSIVGIVIAILLTMTGCKETESSAAASKTATVVKKTNTKQVLPPPLSAETLVSGALRITPGGFDFSIVEPSSSHEVKATLQNTGTQPITFVKISPSCACTSIQDYTKVIIPPGESIPFEATFKAPTEPGLKEAYIQIVFKHGSAQAQAAKIKLQGLVTMSVRAEPPYLNAYKQIQRGTSYIQAFSGETAVVSVDGKPFSIISSDGKKPVYADGFDPGKDNPRSSYTIKWNIPERNAKNCAGSRRWWVIETDHPDCPILPMRVRNECTASRLDMPQIRNARGWYFKEYISQLGAIQAGKPVEAEVLIPLTKEGIKILSVKSNSQSAFAQLISSVTSDDGKSITCRVRLTPSKSFRGMLYAMVMFNSNTGSKDIPFIAKVVTPEN